MTNAEDLIKSALQSIEHAVHGVDDLELDRWEGSSSDKKDITDSLETASRELEQALGLLDDAVAKLR